ncbi:RNA ligase family protein [Pseudomonas aeruginosa]
MNTNILLSADGFREAVFQRDKGRCVICGSPADQAHPILALALFDHGGSYLNNGAALCKKHALQAKRTEISVEAIRAEAGIKPSQIILPDQMKPEEVYDTWGNEILRDGRRTIGALYFEEEFQQILKEAGLDAEFVRLFKYPRTYHAPFSLTVGSDDKRHRNMDHFHGKWVIVTIKADGENTTMASDYFHARSVDGNHHPSRDWVKAMWGRIKHEIPDFWRICGENLYAQHSIAYENLLSYFYGFSIWNERNVCQAWKETLSYFDMLSIVPVRTVYEGIYDEELIKKIFIEQVKSGEEGIVIRLAEEFKYKDFGKSTAKAVRQNHVTTDDHWMHSQIVPNGLAR